MLDLDIRLGIIIIFVERRQDEKY
jgi:hypothetical protein